MGAFSRMALELAEREPPHQAGNAPSAAAAASIKSVRTSIHQQIITYLMSKPNGATDQMMQDDIGIEPNTQRPRRRELQEGNIIKDSGRTAATRSGRKATLWVLV